MSLRETDVIRATQRPPPASLAEPIHSLRFRSGHAVPHALAEQHVAVTAPGAAPTAGTSGSRVPGLAHAACPPEPSPHAQGEGGAHNHMAPGPSSHRDGAPRHLLRRCSAAPLCSIPGRIIIRAAGTLGIHAALSADCRDACRPRRAPSRVRDTLPVPRAPDPSARSTAAGRPTVRPARPGRARSPGTESCHRPA